MAYLFFFPIFEARNLGVILDFSLSPAFHPQLVTKSNQLSRHNRCWVATTRNKMLLSWEGRHNNVMVRCLGGGGRNATKDALGERRNTLIVVSKCY